MSLIMCKCCRREISVNAKSCPNCGEPIDYSEDEKQQAIKEDKQATIITVIILLLFIVLVFWGVNKWISPKLEKASTSFLEKVFQVDIVD